MSLVRGQIETASIETIRAHSSSARKGGPVIPVAVDVLVPTLKGLNSDFIEHVRSRIPVHCIRTSAAIGPAKARQELMEQADTEWFAFIDDDVRLRPDWWKAVTDRIGPEVGGVEGLWSYLEGDKRVDDYTRAMDRLGRFLGRESWRDRIDRAFTGDTLVRTHAVKGIRMPNIPVWEDEFIRMHVEKQGYQWLRTQRIVCDHLRKYNLRPSYNVGLYGYYLGKLTLGGQFRRVAQLPVKVLFSLAYTGNIYTGSFAIEKDFGILKGVIQGYVRRKSGDITAISVPAREDG